MGRVAARLVGTPCVVNTIHGFDAIAEDRFVKRAAFMTVEWLAARCSDLELYQGEEDLARSRRLRIAGERKAAFLGNGTDLSKFDPDRVGPEQMVKLHDELGSHGEVVVGMIGRLVAEKGYREFFAAARRVRAERPDVRFVAVGEPDLAKADAIGEAEMQDARADVTFLGWRDDVPDLLAQFDVFVLPSWREGVPRSAIEAAASGIPLVLSDIPGCRQVARHGIEGLLVPPRRADLLGREILRLASDADLRRRMGAAARARALERLDERQVIATILDRYRLLLAGKGLVAPVTLHEGEPAPTAARWRA
jgi:glycosyltransferase involved in cell wall biosynthesis